MTRRIAVLHTSLVFITVEPAITNLLGELIPDAELLHFIDSDVLATVMREGRVSEQSVARMTYLAKAAEAASADVIFSACSSLGPALDVAATKVRVPVVKIDQAMASEAVDRGQTIGVLATVPTTLAPTCELITAHASEVGKEVSVVPSLADGAFEVLMSGDRQAHDRAVTAAAKSLAQQVDVIVLAQASMSQMAVPLQNATGLPVLTSPRSGVEYLARRVAELPR